MDPRPHHTIPSKGREFYRSGRDFKISTFRKFPHYLQANIAAVPRHLAGDFAEFCKLNRAPLPLIFRSSPGQVNADFLAPTSDIRSDLPAYIKHATGHTPEILPDLLHEEWSDIVTFYLGCSFTFDEALRNLNVAVPSEGNNNIGVHLTNISCIPVGVLRSRMVVSMRNVPVETLEKMFNITAAMDIAHGAPIHIGCPSDIGLSVSDDHTIPGINGMDSHVMKGHVPCFWACGVTAMECLKTSISDVFYNHFPGCMFVTDLTQEEANARFSSSYPVARVIHTSRDRYVPVSVGIWDIMSTVENILIHDPGARGIAPLLLQGDLGRAVLDLSVRGRHVAIFTGFPCWDDDTGECGLPPEENDGIAGAIYIARALQALGIQVTFILDFHSTLLKGCLEECFTRGYLHKAPNTLIITQESDLSDGGVAAFSHFLAIEKPSPAVDGTFRNMRGMDVSHRMGHSPRLYDKFRSYVTTIGIGDGGNEIGMGKVGDSVRKHVNHGHVIAADVTCDFLVTAGVSNWGGLGVAVGLYLCGKCPVHERYQRRGIGPRRELEIDEVVFSPVMDLELHEFLTEFGFRDGVTGKKELTIDGLEYHGHHAPQLEKLREMAQGASQWTV